MTDGPSLAPWLTLGLENRAREIRLLQTPADIERWLADTREQRRLVLGGGSNVVFTRDFPGSVGVVRFPGIRQLESDADGHYVAVGGGENWHGVVRWTLARGLPGLENLSLIPGTAGAAPMQNIGAYGVELDQRFHSLDAIELETGRQYRFGKAECAFAYRDSRFKREPGQWLITRVVLRLPRRWEPVLHYAGLREALAAEKIDEPDAVRIAETVSRIRQRKLPDPSTVGNVGSFFKNPVVSAGKLSGLHEKWPAMPHWPVNGGHKLSAGWLIEQAGWRGKRHNDAGVYEGHALVLVNHGGATGAQIWALAREIQASVEARFGVRLSPEPRIL